MKTMKNQPLRLSGLPTLVLLLPLLLSLVHADYDCICNYKVEAEVYKTPSMSGETLGYLYEFDCKAIYGPLQGNFSEIEYEHSIGYVQIGPKVNPQTCPGDIPDADKVTTSAPTAATTTPSPTPSTTKQPATTTPIPTTTTPRPTTTPKPTTITSTPRPTTTTKPTTIPTHTTTSTTQRPTTIRSTLKLTTKPSIPEGHVELCPNTTRTDVSQNHGYLGQYGKYCYEYVPYKTQWKNAERHCNLVSRGNLAYIMNQDEQDFVLRFIKSHHYNEPIWIGLTDSDTEGTWTWSSGAAVNFKHFQRVFSYHTDREHKLNDCIVLNPNGEWVDIPCGVPLLLGGGFGEAHAYVCQYNLTSKPFGIFEGYLPGFIVG